MDTFCEISCYGSERGAVSKAIKEVFGEIKRIGKIFNKFDEESEVSLVNRLAGTEEVKISRELFDMIESSLYYSAITSGSFDITVEPNKRGRYKEIVLDKDKSSVSFLSNDIKIDLGGIVKGYAVDRAKDILLSHGIDNALINIGGNMFAIASPPGRDSWRIGIRHPRSKKDIIYKLDLKDMGVSTSGDYERPHHIVDPRDGKIPEELMSVSVVADSAERADALSTAIFVMGIEKGMRLLDSMQNIEVYVVDRDAKLTKYP